MKKGRLNKEKRSNQDLEYQSPQIPLLNLEDIDELLKQMVDFAIKYALKDNLTIKQIRLMVAKIRDEFNKLDHLIINSMLSNEKLRMLWLREILSGVIYSIHSDRHTKEIVNRFLSSIPHSIN